MKLKTKITLILAFLAVVLIIMDAVVLTAEDRTGPVITFPSDSVLYTEGMSDEALLEGVTATDSRDGDVTASLRVGEVLGSVSDSYVSVIYFARDAGDNITQKIRKLTVEDTTVTSNTSPSEELEPEDTDEPEPEPEVTEEPEPVVTEEPEPEVTAEPEIDANEEGRLENEEKIAALSDEAPRVYLTSYAITVPLGTAFSPLNYVEDIADDRDDRNALYLDIQIDGIVDTNTPGEYALYYYVTDSDGYMSNYAKLSVNVE